MIEPVEILTDIHVRIEPRWGYRRNSTPDEMKRTGESLLRDAEEILSQAKRHVDDIGYSEVLSTKKLICPLCTAEWELDENGPMCCNAAGEAWKAPATEPCEACHGTGCEHVGECMIDEPCEECNGEGKVEVEP